MLTIIIYKIILTTMVVNIINELGNLGLGEYEARAYTELLRTDEPLGAYEIAKNSRIPSSKIYEVMIKLEEKGIVQSAETGSVKKYIPLDPAEFTARHRLKTESFLEKFIEEVHSLKGDSRSSVIFNISEYALLIDKASRMISLAENEILVSLWNDEFEHLAGIISEAENRGVKVAIIHFGEISGKSGQLFLHPIADTIYSEKGGRGLVVVCDSGEALMGTIYRNGTADGGFSKNSGFVTLAEDYIKHDIYIMKIVNRYESELKKRFGDNYEMLRDIFSDREEGR
ncbi:MAG: hypothetical protein CVV49_09250 [Spirochaetae bacterium HGW-Spirochaetae-5]|nr:MAG: hypothetical protein CVV49_09250 [Spirochaetae bacterium HGW-Spirochaetae-5]